MGTRDDDFYEDDESVAKIVELFEHGPTFRTLEHRPILLSLGRYQWRLDMSDQTEIVSFTVTNRRTDV